MLHTADYIAGGREIAVDYEPGTVSDVELEDGSHVLLRKLDVDYDPADAISALKTIHETRERGEFVTGLLYVDTKEQDLCAREHLASSRSPRSTKRCCESIETRGRN